MSPTHPVVKVTTPESANVDSRVRTLLQHPTQRPPDVSAQFKYVGGAGPGPCLQPGGQPRVTIYPWPFAAETVRPGNEAWNHSRITYGQGVDVCFNSLGPGPVDVSVDGPGHHHEAGVLPRLPPSYRYGSEWTAYDWVPVVNPSWPLGRYTISARAAGNQVSTSFQLIAPWETGLRIVGPSTDPGHNEVAPNSRAEVFLVGFRHVHTVRITVYRLQGMAGQARFFSSANIPMPSSGNVLFSLPTGKSGPETTFVVTAKSGSNTLYAPVSIFPPYSAPNLVVGTLPSR